MNGEKSAPYVRLYGELNDNLAWLQEGLAATVEHVEGQGDTVPWDLLKDAQEAVKKASVLVSQMQAPEAVTALIRAAYRLGHVQSRVFQSF